jgi:phosphopantetheine adenylyltransferase
VNSDREVRGLKKITAIQPNDWPGEIWTDDSIVFLEDYDGDINIENDSNKGENDEGFLTGGYHVPSSSLYNHVAVGGTFDGMHYGHRKLLTLAVSSVVPNTGLLTIGITKDEMLQQKEFATLIPNLKTRIKGVKDFVGSLAPGMKNRIKIVPIEDKYGPPGAPSNSDVYKEKNDYDALVLSHETLETGRMLNKHRVDVLGMPPLTLLCTRRTEAYGMSSTTLRRMKNTTNVVNECEIS